MIIIKNKRQDSAITLIALVITIIILLILAGVTIGFAMNGTGLFDKAKLATDRYNNEVDKENYELGQAINNIDNYSTFTRASVNTSLDYDNGVNLSNVLNVINASYTVQSDGYVFIYAAKGTDTNGVYELDITKDDNLLDKVFFQDRTSSTCNFTDHIIVNSGVTLKAIDIRDITKLTILFYPFK